MAKVTVYCVAQLPLSWTCEYAPASEEQYGFGAAIVVTIR